MKRLWVALLFLGVALVLFIGTPALSGGEKNSCIDQLVKLSVLRFTDNGDGTVTDNLTGLMWLKDANCIANKYPGFDEDGRVLWPDALDFVAGINNGTYSLCGAGYTDWRLPNLRELQSLVEYGVFNPALPSTHLFVGVQGGYGGYWSSNTFAGYTPPAPWLLSFNDGAVIPREKEGEEHYVLCVRGGEKNSCIDKLVKLSVLRFTDNGDGTVTDNWTRLVWMKNGGNAGGVNGFGAMDWEEACTACATLNSNEHDLTDGSAEGDWRLPNLRELQSLVEYDVFNPALPSGHPFVGVQSVGVQEPTYWSSNTNGNYASYAWGVSFFSGYVGNLARSNNGYVWCVRAGK